ncbi:hypothetical protein GTQ34_03305 [Muricauda sp. JGD-17]|uniref:HEPN AbiU2-like domain-containing protein n=1 Tax=Flagellimonas ochracea TaxID=2696472 RepID=A0A964TB70_9FLAO|nr:hypothetical protein [Allomuricauda ochracea]NAY90936.1 hypothetical protein [Allomuricauda ochracea]
MITEKQKKEYATLRVEIIDINILSYSFFRKINQLPYAFKNLSRHDVFAEYSALRYMENGLILHLTNLDDDRSKFSFRKIQKELKRSFKDQKTLKKLDSSLKKYRIQINHIKVKHRNDRIAHMNYKEDLNIDQFLAKYLIPIIKTANEIGDFIWGEEINYKFKLGSHEGILDFRNELKKL